MTFSARHEVEIIELRATVKVYRDILKSLKVSEKLMDGLEEQVRKDVKLRLANLYSGLSEPLEGSPPNSTPRA